jgi:hypothetical protein
VQILQLINQNVHLIKQFMTSIKLQHVSTPGCHPQEVFRTKGFNTLI